MIVTTKVITANRHGRLRELLSAIVEDPEIPPELASKADKVFRVDQQCSVGSYVIPLLESLNSMILPLGATTSNVAFCWWPNTGGYHL